MKAIAAASTVAVAALIIVPVVSAKDGENSGPGNLRNLPQIKNIEKLSTRSGEFLKKVEDRIDTRSGKLNELKEKFASRAGEFEHKFASLSGKLKEDRSKRIAKLNETITQRFTKLTDRQENILKRANVRIASLSAQGTNVSEVTAKSASVSTMISKQRASIVALKATLDAIIAANSAGGTQNIGSAVSDVVKQVGQTQKALQDLVRAIAKLTPRPSHSGEPSHSPRASTSASPTI